MRDELLNLIKELAYKKGEFTLSSGKSSKHYVNCKPVTLSGLGLKLCSLMMLQHVEEDSKAVAGLTLGADPLVSGVAMASVDQPWAPNLDALIVRKEPKGHGTASQIEGPVLPKGSKVTVLEDVVTTGGSSVKAVQVLRDVGYEVDTIITIVNRKEYDKWLWYDKSINLVSLFTIEDICQG